MRIASCMVCGEGFEYASFGEAEHTMGGDCVGVCPTCRRHAEIGRRVEGMEEKDLAFVDADEVLKAERVGWNKALRVAKKGEW